MLIYIAGPYTNGDKLDNVARALEAADLVVTLGHVPLVPHLAHFWDMISPKDYETWLAIDLAYLAKCDALIRLPGQSPGADREVKFATEHGIHVFYGLAEFAAWLAEWVAMSEGEQAAEALEKAAALAIERINNLLPTVAEAAERLQAITWAGVDL